MLWEHLLSTCGWHGWTFNRSKEKNDLQMHESGYCCTVANTVNVQYPFKEGVSPLSALPIGSTSTKDTHTQRTVYINWLTLAPVTLIRTAPSAQYAYGLCLIIAPVPLFNAISLFDIYINHWLECEFGDFPELDDEDWKEVWEFPFLQLVSAKDRPI